nr:hypothetical protein [Tanacetum cinerariifolium]
MLASLSIKAARRRLGAVLSVDGILEPFDTAAVDRHHVDAAGRHAGAALQIDLGGAHHAADLGGADAGRGADLGAGGALA